eukprot:jgi/Hompol1/1905/HPOL_005780-RA
MRSIELVARYTWAGLYDASSWPLCLFVIYGSTTLKTKLLHSLLVNSALFLSSLLVFNYIMAPLASQATRSLGLHLNAFAASAYYAFWIYPLCTISLLANNKVYNEISARCYQIFHGKQARSNVDRSLPKLLRSAISDAYRGLLMLIFLMQAAIAYNIPVVGSFISFWLFTFASAFFAFEYRWAGLKRSLAQEIDFFETHWAYFAGFGLPLTVPAFFFPQTISLGVFAIMFPMFIIMANAGKPLPTRKDPIQPHSWLARLPVFWLSQKTAQLIISFIKRRRDAIAVTSSSSSSSSPQAANHSEHAPDIHEHSSLADSHSHIDNHDDDE